MQMTGLQERQASEEEDNGASGVVESTEGEGGEPSLSDLVAILRGHMGQQEAREAKQNEVTARQEQRFKALQHQFQLLQLEVQTQTSPVPDPLLTDPGSEVQSSTMRPPQAQAEPNHGPCRSFSLTMSREWKN